VSVQKREGEGGLNRGQWWRMGGSHREATETGALGREPEMRRGLQWRKPVEKGGKELELGCGQEGNGEKRERVAAGSF
jgi:hypothetical protein